MNTLNKLTKAQLIEKVEQMQHANKTRAEVKDNEKIQLTEMLQDSVSKQSAFWTALVKTNSELKAVKELIEELSEFPSDGISELDFKLKVARKMTVAKHFITLAEEKSTKLINNLNNNNK